jgi:hypothetical protein
MGWFDNILNKPIKDAKVAAEEVVEKIDPIIHTAEMRLAGILDTLVDRIGAAKITITIDIPKAGAEWEKNPPAKDK